MRSSFIRECLCDVSTGVKFQEMDQTTGRFNEKNLGRSTSMLAKTLLPNNHKHWVVNKYVVVKHCQQNF